jgi:uncharacterized Rmd1/YagE family protein
MMVSMLELGSVVPAMSSQPQAAKRRRVRAFLLSDRIDTANLEHDGVVSTAPVTYKFGKDGFVTLFRYGVAVTLCLSPEEEQQVLRTLETRLIRPIAPPEEETLFIEQAPDKDDQILPGGPLLLKTITPEHLIVIADALSKSVVLARDEREVAGVFEIVEPFARQLAEKGRIDAGRRTILKHIGNALLVQHRLSGRVAVTEKPDVVWDRQDLDRLYARLEDEYELKERAEALSRKLEVIAETAEILTDTIDTKRSLRLEVIIVILIAVELAIAGFQVIYTIG